MNGKQMDEIHSELGAIERIVKIFDDELPNLSRPGIKYIKERMDVDYAAFQAKEKQPKPKPEPPVEGS